MAKAPRRMPRGWVLQGSDGFLNTRTAHPVSRVDDAQAQSFAAVVQDDGLQVKWATPSLPSTIIRSSTKLPE